MKKKINMWRLSLASIGIALSYGAYFVYAKTISSMIVMLILLALSFAFYYYASKKITLPEGYTVIQARSFYRACLDAGINSRRKLTENREKLDAIVKKKSFADGMDDEALWKLYCNGKSTEDSIEK